MCFGKIEKSKRFFNKNGQNSVAKTALVAKQAT
jgi:hypothetical protein